MDALTIIICIQMHIVTLSHPADLTAKVGEMDKMNSHWHHLGGQCGGGAPKTLIGPRGLACLLPQGPHSHAIFFLSYAFVAQVVS